MSKPPQNLKTGITSRADLIDLLAGHQGQVNELLVAAIGFEQLPPPPEQPVGRNKLSKPGNRPRRHQTADPSWTQFDPLPVSYWRVVAAVKKEQDELADGEVDTTKPDQTEPPLPEELLQQIERLMPPPLQWQPLTTESSVMTRLRKAATANRSRLEMDLPRAVELLSRGHFLYRLPKRARKVWGHDLLVIEDRSRRLVPYWKDQDAVSQWLYKAYPETGFQYARLQEGHDRPLLVWPLAFRDQPLELPPPGTLILALTDLGALWSGQEADQHPAEVWEHWGRILKDNGNQALALIPCSPERIPSTLAALWHLIPWDASQHTAPDDARDRLLGLLAPCVRLEPELLRALRRLLPAARCDASLEAAIWQDPLLKSPHSNAASLNPDHRKSLRRAFDEEPEPLRAAALQHIQAARQATPSTWCEELLSLVDTDQKIEFIQTQLEISKQWFVSLQHHTDAAILRRSAGWLERLSERLPEMRKLDVRTRRALEELIAVVPQPEGGPVRSWQSRQIPWRAGNERTVRVSLCGDRLVFDDIRHTTPAPHPENSISRTTLAAGSIDGPHAQNSAPKPETTARRLVSPGCFLADVRMVGDEIRLHESTASDNSREPSNDNFWKSGWPPAWVQDYGRDEFGLWCTFEINGVSQRTRWVSPGTFQMGSPESEKGRDNDEGPRHPVTISRGFWMFDTPCTQALWEAVSGENRSRRKGLQRPVENVSWHETQEFIRTLNSLLPGLELRLPTEAEWEYSCRAGNDDTRYGNLDEVAWHSGNSDSTTHDVGAKQPNAWGFHDMLGNVYEWCQDHWCRRYEESDVTDPLHMTDDEDANRVIRGGSWYGSAPYVRAAYRHYRPPGHRYVNLGFRCLSSPEPSQPSGAVMSVSAAQRSGAEPTANNESPRSAAIFFGAVSCKVNLADADSLRIPVTAVSGWHLETDREIVTIERSLAPPWAQRAGRDQYGLWSELVVDNVRQRLRWIPPGRFLMGTPLEEEGRQSWELTPREVTLTKGFWMFDTPCTQQLWKNVMDTAPSRFEGALLPVEQVTWRECQEFLNRLNEQFSGLHLRLPTEAQWEYACRAGTMAPRYGELNDIAWYHSNSDGNSHDVKSKQPNPWGLYDTLGNVWEWCQDHWNESDDLPPVDPLYETEESDADRVIRGGSWGNSAPSVRAAYRSSRHPGDRHGYLGFRCLSSPEPSQASGAVMSVSAS